MTVPYIECCFQFSNNKDANYAIECFRHAVKKKVVQFLKDRIKGNTMTKVWRQVTEAHCQKYLNGKELYSTLLHQLTKPGTIVVAVRPKFPPPAPRRELPTPKLFRLAHLNAEWSMIEDHKTQITLTFAKVLKLDSTKKVS